MRERPRHLPDWNDLPDALRSALVDIVDTHLAGSNVEDYAGAIALPVYDTLARDLPAPVFPLFERSVAAWSSGVVAGILARP